MNEYIQSCFGKNIHSNILDDKTIQLISDTLEPPPDYNFRNKKRIFDVYVGTKAEPILYNGKQIIIKEIKNDDIEVAKLIINEVLINALVYNITKGNNMVAARPIGLFKDSTSFYFYQEKVVGRHVSELNEDEMLDCLLIITKELTTLQTFYNFMHKDFKSDNIIYTLDKKVCLIDFEYSCITYDGFDIQGIEESCKNNSADICFLILNIYAEAGLTKTPPLFIQDLAHDISKAIQTDECDKIENNKVICGQNIVYELHNTLDSFIPPKIYKFLKKEKNKNKENHPIKKVKLKF